MGKTKTLLKTLILGLFSTVLIYSSCEIGLGAAVDTLVPTISIDSPAADSTIRDSFSFRGTWSDDGAIMGVSVTLNSINTDGTTKPVAAKNGTVAYAQVLGQQNTWLCEINPGEDGIKDGNYEANIVITDLAGHSTTATRQITIDNTAPVVVLQRPSTRLESAESDTYGQTVSIEGQAADDSGVGLIEMRIYGDEECTQLLHTAELKNVPNSISMDVAKFESGNTVNDYYKIYGSTNAKGGAKQVWCQIIAYDGAQRYPADGSEQSEEDIKGNAAKEYYLYSEISADILQQYKITEVYAMKNGTYGSGDERSAAGEAVLELLKTREVGEGKFTVNPDNDPTFVVNGMSALKSGERMTGASGDPLTSYQVVNESKSLVVEVSPGLDKITIDPDSVEIKLVRCNDRGEPLEGTGAAEIMLMAAGNYGDRRTTVGTSYKYTTDIIGIESTPGVKTDAFYRVDVSGVDTKGNHVHAANGSSGEEQIYAFYLAPSGSMIDLSLDRSPDYISTEAAARAVNKALSVSLDYSYTDNPQELYLYRSYEDEVSEMTESNRVAGVVLACGENKTYTDKIPSQIILKGDGSKSQKVWYQIKSADGNGVSRKKYVSFWWDNTRPEINSVELPSGLGELSGANFSFSVNHNADEAQHADSTSGIEKIEIRISDISDPGKTTGWLTATGGKLTIKKSELPDGGAFDSEGLKKVEAKITDNVGLESDVWETSSWVYDTESPGINGVKYSEKGSDGSFGAYSNVSGGSLSTGKKIKLCGKATDRYGIQSVKIRYKNGGGDYSDALSAAEKKEINTTLSAPPDSDGVKTYDWESAELPEEAISGSPTYEFVIEAEDLAGNKSTQTVAVMIDMSAPSVTEIDNPGADPAPYGENSVKGSPDGSGKISFRFSGNAHEEGLGLERLYYYIADGNVSSAPAKTDSGWQSQAQTSERWNVTTELGEGEKTFFVYLKDKAGNESEITSAAVRHFYVDNADPVLTIRVEKKKSDGTYEAVTAPADGKYVFNEGSGAEGVKVSFSASDNNGIKEIRVKKDGVAQTLENGAFEITAEGSYQIEGEAEDNCGASVTSGRKNKKSISIVYDKTKPELNVSGAKTDAEDAAGTRYWVSGDTIYVSGSVTDSQSGVKESYIKIDNGTEKALPAAGNWTYQYSVPSNFAENTRDAASRHSVTIRGEDNAGNTDSKTWYFRYDKNVPVVSIETSGEYINGKDGSSITVSGQAYDAEGTRAVHEAKIKITKQGEPEGDGEDLTLTNTPAYGSYSHTISGSSLSAEGKYDVKVVAEDYAGKKESKTAVITVDKTAPTNISVSGVGGKSVNASGEVTDWLGSKSVNVSVSAADNNGGSGISSVSAGVDGTDESGNAEKIWTQLTAENGAYEGTVTFRGTGDKTLYVKAKDKAGNESAETEITVHIDITAPEVKALLYKAEGAQTLKSAAGTVYANGTKKITVYGNYKDEESGVKALTLNVGDGTIAADKIEYSTSAINESGTTVPGNEDYHEFASISNKKAIRSWKAEFTPTESLSGQFKMTGYNGTYTEGGEEGKKEESSFTITFDTVNPVFNSWSINGAYYDEGRDIWFVKDGTYTVSGVCDDVLSGMDSVTLEITDHNGETHKYKNNGSKTAWNFNKEIKNNDGSSQEVDISFTESSFGTAANAGLNANGVYVITADAIVTIKAYDNAGNEETKELKLEFDNGLPYGKHEVDSSEKDLYFRIGTDDNDVEDDLNACGLGTTLTDADKKVGGKYKLDTYGKNLTITISGRAEDGEGGSGIRMIYYKVYNPTENAGISVSDETQRNTLATAIKASPTGSFMLSTAEKEKRVFYNVSTADRTAGRTLGGTQGRGTTADDENYKYYKNVKTNYEATLNGFNEGSNYLYIVFEDNAGNLSLNDMNIGSETYYTCSLNVDTQPPTGETDKKENIYSNGSGIIQLSGTVDDNYAGIDKVTIKIGSTEVGKATLSTIPTESEKSLKRKWEYNLDASLLGITTSSTSNISVMAIAKDKARNETPIAAATVTPDTTGPEVTITIPKDADSTKSGHRINGTITISGSANDLHGLHTDGENEKTLKLYYTKNEALTEEVSGVRKVKLGTGGTFDSGDNEATQWKETGSARHGSTWTIEDIDTTAFGNDGTTIYITARAMDSAGNWGYAPVSTVVVDQHTDRPKISFSTIKMGSGMAAGAIANDYSNYVWLKNQTTVKFNVSDDDGEIEWVKVSLDGSDYRAATPDEESGEWGYDLKNFSIRTTDSEKEEDANGPKTIYFKVKDKGKRTVSGRVETGREFESGEDNDLGAVYLVDGTNVYGGDVHKSSILYVKADTIFPEVVLKGVQVGSNAYSTSYATQKTGGKENTIRAKFSARDANGMKAAGFAGSAEYVYRVGDIPNKETVSATVTGPDAVGDYEATFKLTDEQYDTLQGYDGEVNIRVSGEDSAGNVTPQTASIQFDYKPAEVVLMNPKATDTISGAVDAYGSVLETATLKYALTAENGSEPAAADYSSISGVTASWTISFDGETDTGSQTHTKTLNKYLIDLGIAEHDASSTSDDAIDPSVEDFKTLKLWIQSTDGAGNVKAFGFPLTVDPQGDKPTLKLSYPTSDGTTVGGALEVYGTAMDLKGSGENNANAGVDSVWMQIISKTHEKDSDAATKSWGNVTNFTLTADDLNYMKEYGEYKVFNRKKYDATKTPEQNSSVAWTGSLGSGEKLDDYAAYVTIPDSSWSQTVNGKEELNPASGASEPNTAVIRIYARDKDKKFSQYKECRISVDSDTPEIKNLVLKDMTSIDAASATAEKVYTESMYVKGDWYLTGTVTDKDMISYLKVGNHELVSGEKVQSGDTVTWTITTADATDASGNVIGRATLSSDKKTVSFIYKLETGSGNGVLSVNLIAKDAVTSGQPHAAGEGKPLVINYDNTPPEHLTTATSFGTQEGGRTVIAQKNGWYTISAKAREDGNGQSGFAYTAFYFERTLNGTKYIYDILKGRNDARITLPASVPDMGEETVTTDGTLVKKDGIYWIRKNVTSAINSILTLDGSNIRRNSLVSVNGSLYTITEQTATSITLDANPAGSVSKVYVAVAGLIDNTTTERLNDSPVKDGTDGYYEAESFIHDDGDRMSESVVKTQSIWEWEASLNSRNIPDGPVTIHYVAYDKAGNPRHGSQTAYISNNKPRLAGVILKTDYNGDRNFTEDTATVQVGEVIKSYASSTSYENYYTGIKETGASAKYVFDPDEKVYGTNSKNPLGDLVCGTASVPVAVLRGKTEIIPEIVGGNGAIRYEYDVGGVKGKNLTALITEGSIDYTAIPGTIKVHPGDLRSFGDGASKLFRFVFWDSTEGGTTLQETNPDGTPDTQSVTLDMYLGIGMETSGTPEVKIKPFYWNSIEDNSVYTSKARVSSYKDLDGHIELTSDLNFDGTTFTASSGLMDKDPKVSGKIIIEGTAHDDSLIAQMDAVVFGTELNLANYSGGHLVPVRTAANGFGTTAATGWYFEVVSQTTGKDGDDVEWKLYIDTELLGQAALDASVTVTATNFGTPDYAETETETEVNSINGTTKWNDAPSSYTGVGKNTPGTTQTASTTDTENNPVLTAYYRMDIVPYIREVKTSLSEVYSGNPTVYSRTALGHYPVYVTFAGGSNYNNGRLFETITLTGFNLAGCTLNFENDDPNTLKKGSGENNNTNILVDNTASAKLTDDGKYQIPTGAGSGHVYVSINIGTDAAPVYVRSLNNANNNNAKGSVNASATGAVGETGDATVFVDFYNRQPNGVNNNRLTDDVYIDVWEFNREAAKAYNNGRVDNLEMKINPDDGMLGFAFSNGSSRFAMPQGKNKNNKNNNSYQHWNRTFDYMSYNALAYDIRGYTYALTVGGDISSGGATDLNSLMSSRWGVADDSIGSYANNYNRNHLRIECTGQQAEGENVTTQTFVKKNRFSSQSLATRVHENNGTVYTDLFHAYCDTGNDEVRLKVGTISGIEGFGNKKADILDNPTYGQFIDRGNGNNADNHKYSQQITRNLIIAKTSDSTNTLGTAGLYVSVGVTQKTDNPVVVVVWHDGSNLQYAFRNYTYNNNELNTVSGNAQKNIGTTTTEWTVKKLTSGGEYCQLVVASDDSIHIAAYDSDSTNLKYIYIPTYNGTPVVATVDSYGDVGTYLTIDVAKVGNNQIPYIGYTAAEPEMPRYAYLANPPATYSSASLEGASGEFCTGVWETTVVPTNGVDENTVTGSSMLTNREISVGLWKNAGALAYSTTGEKKGTASGTISYTSSYANATTDADATAGICYGNGSKNGVLSYVVKKTAQTWNAETAQKR